MRLATPKLDFKGSDQSAEGGLARTLSDLRIYYGLRRQRALRLLAL